MRTIVLTGPKHCGKTSAGKALAALLTCDFFDLDGLIAQQTGKSPRELYRESPETFQKAETCALKTLALVEPSNVPQSMKVIAAGGGIIDNPEAMALLEASGALTAYLSVSTDCAWERISRKKELPPFLQTDNPRETHRVLHERRGAAYRAAAQIVIEASGKTPEEIASEIREQIANMN
jgi:shikimate kinase